jgi:7,8-dihydropterin-6-yl-methyl-4-(beta-D-ribofuranosyl)aminobenzene 5'-phosphate synthase
MKITVLTENKAGKDFLAEHGLSYFIEHDGKTILFDTGHSDVFLKNAERMGINLHKETDMIVLSHGHWDHGNGLHYLENTPLLTHPSAFIKRYHKEDNKNIGLDMDKSKILKKFKLITSDKPYQVSKKIVYLGEIPRINEFEARNTPFEDEYKREDFVPDDSALVLMESESLVVVTGCSHAGICNITDYAMKVSGIGKVSAVIGGFHLKDNDWQTQKTIQYFREQKVSEIYPSHCTGTKALEAFYREFGEHTVKAGMIFTF